MKQTKFDPKIKDITQTVKNIVGSQLQKIRTFKDSSTQEYALLLDFYPGERDLWHLRLAKNIIFISGLVKNNLRPQAHPAELYLRAHFEGAKCHGLIWEESKVVYDFGPRGGFSLQMKSPKGVELQCQVPQKKLYRSQFLLQEWKEEGQTEAENLRELPSKELNKWRRLLEKVQADFGEAQQWLQDWGPFCGKLESDPSFWFREATMNPAEKSLLNHAVATGELPRPSAQSLGEAQNKLFKMRRRFLRKYQSSEKRLLELRSQGAQSYYQKEQSLEVPGALKREAPSTAPKKKPGIWVHVEQKLWVRVGKSARENDELFKQAGDRDLWCHVRGYAGAHVWIPRGQPLFSKKGEVSEVLLHSVCQLALFNSKLRASAQGVVDYTERRYLKKIPGTEGQLSIARSQTLQVRLDSEFERRVLGK